MFLFEASLQALPFKRFIFLPGCNLFVSALTLRSVSVVNAVAQHVEDSGLAGLHCAAGLTVKVSFGP